MAEEGTEHGATPNRVVSVERVIPADAAVIFELLADPAKHPLIDGSGSVRQARPGGPSRLALGTRFGMDMRVGVPYRMKNEVVEFEEGRRIAWRHYGRHVWRYLLEPVAGGTRVIEQFDYRPARSPRMLELAKAPQRNREAMEKTLVRIEEVVAAGP